MRCCGPRPTSSPAPADRARIAAAVTEIARRPHAWVGRSWNRPPNAQAFVGLTRIFAENPDFQARYEGRAKGLTEYIVAAMDHFAATELT